MVMNGLILDAILAPAAVSLMLLYHAFLFHKARKCPMQTVMGVNQKARRLWVYHMVTVIDLLYWENHRKNVLVVQTLRNSIMEASLMASTAVLFTAAVAAYFTVFTTTGSSSFQMPGVAGHDDHAAASAADCAGHHLKPCPSSSLSAVKGTVRCVAVLACFAVSFVCHTQSIRFLNQVNYMANIPLDQMTHFLIVGTSTSVVDSLADMMENGTLLHTLGFRSFYMAFPFLLWVFGCVPMFLSTVALLFVLYRSDFVHCAAKALHDTGRC